MDCGVCRACLYSNKNRNRTMLFCILFKFNARLQHRIWSSFTTYQYVLRRLWLIRYCGFTFNQMAGLSKGHDFLWICGFGVMLHRLIAWALLEACFLLWLYSRSLFRNSSGDHIHRSQPVLHKAIKPGLPACLSRLRVGFFHSLPCVSSTDRKLHLERSVNEFGLSATQSSFLPAAEALGEMVSKLIWGFFFHKVPHKWQKHVVCGQFAFASLLFAILPSIRGFPQLLCTCAAVGIVIGGVDGVYSLFSVEIFGMQSFSSMFGYTNVLAFLLSSVSSLIIGLVIDLTGDPSHAFYFGSVSYVVAAISLFCLHKITVKKVHKFDSP
uniref:Major facilitator superfamily (MFS) profile domain-containing protein n=1 Tax=Ciona savignyi TaxID=51511 RepID=H2YPD3_CIOSA